MCTIASNNSVLRLVGTLLFGVFTVVPQAVAQSVAVTVTDRHGDPVPDVAVFLESGATGREVAPAGTRAVMDQVDQRFVPHILIVQTGTEVDFPNSDTVAHHVYSFSHPNHFKLPMYKGHAHPPVSFADSGVVVLGCNIHDHMLAYIVVVDTPVFAMTDERGIARLEGTVDAAARIRIWSPRIRDAADSLSVGVGDPAAEGIAFRLTKSLRPAHRDDSEVLSWSDY